MFSNRGPLEELQHRDIIHIDIDSDTYSINGEIINSEKIENKTDNIEIFIEDNTEILRCLDAVSTDVCPKLILRIYMMWSAIIVRIRRLIMRILCGGLLAM